MNKNESYSKIGSNKVLKTIFLILFFAVLLVLAFIYRYFLWPFIFALFLYIAFKPLHDFAYKRLNNHFLSTNLSVLVILIVIVAPFFGLAVSLANQTVQFNEYIDKQFSMVELESYFLENKLIIKVVDTFNIDQREIISKVIASLKEQSAKLFKNLFEIATFSFSFGGNLFFMLLTLYFLFAEGYKISYQLYKILPFPNEIEKDIVDRLKNVIKILIAGNLVIMVFQGVMVGLGFAIFGLPIPVLAASIAAIFSLIPVIGTSFVFIPAVIYLIIIGNYLDAGLLLIWCYVWYITLENIVKPRILGKKLNFHPLVFFFLLIGSIKTFGLPGVLLGPVILTLFYSLWEIYKMLDVYGLGVEQEEFAKQNDE